MRAALSTAPSAARHPGRKGVGAIRAALDTGPALTREEFEARFRAFLDAAGLAFPRLNSNVQGYECDCVWPDHALIVELDGRSFHTTAIAFERDRARDRALQMAGWRVIRVTWRQLREESEALARDLRTLLSGKKRA